MDYSWVQLALKIYTSELILCSSICVPCATRHNIHMYPYFLFAAIHHLDLACVQPPTLRLSLSGLVAQSTVTFENVCRVHTKRQVIIKMNKFNMFITARFVSYFRSVYYQFFHNCLQLASSLSVKHSDILLYYPTVTSEDVC